jgi:prepilin-type N-terminal cleavage/methylation domain-containing protein
MASSHPQCRPARAHRAFTLIELLVVTGIIVVVSTVVLADNNRFGGKVQLENLAYDIALSIRQAQVYGISVARFGAGTFSAGYGVHFDTSNFNTYVLFADIYPTPGDGIFQAAQGELVSTTDITSGYRILKVCAPEGTDSTSCTDVGSVDVTFERPEPDAWISAGGTSCAYGLGVCADSARIVLQSPRSDIMSVVMEANGQISIQH